MWHSICRFSALLVAGLAFSTAAQCDDRHYRFTAADKQFLAQFSLEQLDQLPLVRSNRYASDDAAARLGQRLFFDTRFSANGEIACAHCHQPDRYFTDGLPHAMGLGETRRNAPSLIGAAYGPWKYWDGRKDSLWAQALEPLEAENEHGLSRAAVADLIARHYRDDYSRVFGDMPWDKTEVSAKLHLSTQQDATTRIFVNVGKALMAYQIRLQPQAARFDIFLNAVLSDAPTSELKQLLTEDEVAGLRLFVGRAGCASCHNGPLFTNFEFHNVGVPEADITKVDLGRFEGIERLRADAFTCLSRWSDTPAAQCEEMLYLKRSGPELVGAFKTPSLRNVAATAPYMHAGQFADLPAVVAHYNKPTPPFYDPAQHPSRPHFDILPLNLNEQEQDQLVAFLQTLTSPIPENNPWWRSPRIEPTR